jgi:DNA-binding transcriptional regulator YiaG
MKLSSTSCIKRVGDGKPNHAGTALSVSSSDELLERVRARRRLPPPTERRRIRERAGVSLRDLAAAVGVSHATIRNWEAGATPREHRAAYARLLEELDRIDLTPQMREPGFDRAQGSRDVYNDGNDTAA